MKAIRRREVDLPFDPESFEKMAERLNAIQDEMHKKLIECLCVASNIDTDKFGSSLKYILDQRKQLARNIISNTLYRKEAYDLFESYNEHIKLILGL